VNSEEEKKRPGDEEMECARGLATAQQVNGRRNRGIERGRQGEACPDYEGKEDEDDGEVCSSLEHVVGV
jgi:hypothetical protein